MTTTLKLCFTKTGLIQTPDYTKINDPKIEAIALGCDGSLEAIAHMQKFCSHSVFHKQGGPVVRLIHTPMFSTRVCHANGSISKPHYSLNEMVRDKWMCTYIAAPNFHISVEDISSPTGMQVDLDIDVTAAMCYASYRLWNLLLLAERELVFPAAVIDRMTRWTHHLTPRTIDIELLRKETGLATLDYNPMTDLLSIEIARELFVVKLEVLQAVYSESILPHFNKQYGRRLLLSASVRGANGEMCTKVPVTSGELGRIVSDMFALVKEKRITPETPIAGADLILFMDKVLYTPESCIKVSDYDSIDAAISHYRTLHLSRHITNDDTCEEDVDERHTTYQRNAVG